MSEPKFTPGPHEACEPGDYSDFDGDSIVILADDRRIAVVQGSDDEAKATAALYAAAPEIYRALKNAERALAFCIAGMSESDPFIIKVGATHTSAVAALAKALGGGK